MKRGGRPEQERQPGKLLFESGEADIWGWGSPAGREHIRRRVAWLRQVCALGPGRKVLECGCGIGIFTREVAASGADITAVDISADLLARARKECPAGNLTFVADNLEAPATPEDGAFDAVYGISVLHHLNLPQALRALVRLGEAVAERLPLVRLSSGSIWINGPVPGASS